MLSIISLIGVLLNVLVPGFRALPGITAKTVDRPSALNPQCLYDTQGQKTDCYSRKKFAAICQNFACVPIDISSKVKPLSLLVQGIGPSRRHVA